MAVKDVVIFDLDRTLISIDSSNKWVDHMCVKGLIKNQEIYRERKQKYDNDYALGKLDIKSAYLSFIEPMIGCDISSLRHEFLSFASHLIDKHLYPKARKCLDYHQERQDEILLISGCIEDIVIPLGLELGLDNDNIIGAKTEKYKNRFTGKVIEPFSFGTGKCVHFNQWINKKNKLFGKSHFYSDSIHDAPLLSQVDHAICINPDPLLHKKAIEKNWKIEIWD